MTKAVPYILIAVLIVGLISLYLLWTNKKETKEQTDMLKDQGKVQGDQSTMLIAMAKKLIGEDPMESAEKGKQEPEKAQVESIPLTLEEENQIVLISDKLCFGKELNAEENAFASVFSKEINKESQRSKKTLDSLISKFLSGSKDFTDIEKNFYDDNQQDIDELVQNKKLLSSIIAKVQTGDNNFSDEELQFQNNFPKVIEAELSSIKAKADKFKGSNPPNSADERLKLIRSFFEDGMPKTVTQLSKLYGEATNTKPSKGNTSNIFGKLVKEEKILCHPSRKGMPVYHGLPEWFENGKLKPEYKEKISKS